MTLDQTGLPKPSGFMIAQRISNQPVVSPEHCDRIGTNLNGPSVIKVPDWVAHRLGRYYMYFAHHKGRYIRMAYADELTGPWTVYTPGVLDVTETPFAHEDLPPGPYDSYAHVASPDVHVDHDAGLIRMYYHGLEPDGQQLTRHCVSQDGLHFAEHSECLGPPYIRAFFYQDMIYAVSWAGKLMRARNWTYPFETGPDIFGGDPLTPPNTTIRHVAVLINQDQLTLAFSRIGDTPEHLMITGVELGPDWTQWTPSPPKTLLFPELDWEGAHLPVTTSRIGAADKKEHGLRDPCFFENYLFYSGGGESAIGIAKLIADTD